MDLKKALDECRGGVVTTNDWTYAADGDQYKAFYSEKWLIVTDKMVPIEGFRSTEKWFLIAETSAGSIGMIIPGCQVRGFSAAVQYKAELMKRNICLVT